MPAAECFWQFLTIVLIETPAPPGWCSVRVDQNLQTSALEFVKRRHLRLCAAIEESCKFCSATQKHWRGQNSVLQIHALRQSQQIALHGLSFHLETHQLSHFVLGQQMPQRRCKLIDV